ncbi:MAG TPA: hypothetical protein VFJ01_05515 [Oleiagrimonas sp.]|nr:hypothetical protein [Oleiagrimonas sp.]
MNMRNASLEQRMALAIVALKHLDKMGATVTDVDVTRKQPVLRIERNPNRFLRGVMKMRVTSPGGVRHYTLVALVDGCLVEWREDAPDLRSHRAVSA